MFNLPLKNILIFDNQLLSDQEIMEIAKLEDYPPIYRLRTRQIAKDLQKNDYIKTVEIKRVRFSQLHISVEENRPLFYIDYQAITVLSDGTEVDVKHRVPILVNYVPDLIYQDFILKMDLIDDNILQRISEIKYAPNDFDDERFVLYMVDGNYVYVNLTNFLDLNEYLIIMERIINDIGPQKGILNLDAGGYFQVFD